MELARIEGDEIVIRIPIASLGESHTVPGELMDDYLEPAVKVTDPVAFAQEMIRVLNAEDEEGTTAVHILLDETFVAAYEGGAEGIIEVEPAGDPDDEEI